MIHDLLRGVCRVLPLNRNRTNEIAALDHRRLASERDIGHLRQETGWPPDAG